MPELPEVEAARKFVERFCVGLKIVEIVALETGGGPRDGTFDDIVFDLVDQAPGEDSVRKALVNRIISRVGRKGKQLWFDFGDMGSVVMFHFGMTGSIVVKGEEIPLYFRSNAKDYENWPPKFTKLLLKFDGGIELAYRDPRRLGRIKIRTPGECKELLEKLAIDPTVQPIPSASTIHGMLKDIAVPIKAVLLDQERIFSGIGNYLADEILYQAGMHPNSKASALTEAHVQSMLSAMQQILTTAIQVDADYQKFPADWLFHVRWGKAKSKSQKIVLPNGKAVVFEEVGGRTSAVVPSVQKLITAASARKATTSASTASASNTVTDTPLVDVDVKEKGLARSKKARKIMSAEAADVSSPTVEQPSAKRRRVKRQQD